MSAIELNHVTNIPLDRLSELAKHAKNPPKSLSLSKRFFLMAGILINKPARKQPETSLDSILSQIDESGAQLLDVVRFIEKKGWARPKPSPEWVDAEKERKFQETSKTARRNAQKRRLSDSETLQKYGISFKSQHSIERKAANEYMTPEGPDYSRITDYVRTTLHVRSLKDIVTLSNYFRPCNNPNTVAFENSFACKNDENGMRRLKIVYRLPNGFLVEIQVHHPKAELAYKKSHDAYEIERGIADAAPRATDPQTHRALGKLHVTARTRRLSINEKVNEDLGLNGLVLQRKYFTINGFPVMHVYNPFTTNAFTVVPNPLTGFFEVDDRFRGFLEKPTKGYSVAETTRDDFIIKSTALSHSPQVKDILMERGL